MPEVKKKSDKKAFKAPIVRGVPNDADAYLTRFGRIEFRTGNTGKYQLYHPIAMGSIYNMKTGKSSQPLHQHLGGTPWTLWTSHGTTHCFWTNKEVVIPNCELMQYLPWCAFPRTDLYYESVKRSEDLFNTQAAKFGFREKWSNGNWLKTGISTLTTLTNYGLLMDDIVPYTLMMGTFLFIDETVDNHTLFLETTPEIVGKVADSFGAVCSGQSEPEAVRSTFGLDKDKFHRLFPDYIPLTNMAKELCVLLYEADRSSDFAKQAFVDYTSSLRPEAELRKKRSTGTKITVEEFLDVRRHSVGMYPCIEMVAYLHKARVPQDIRDDPLFIKLRMMTSTHVVLVNDLYSARREVLAGEPFNAVCIRYLNGEYGGDFAKCFKSVEDDSNTIGHNVLKWLPDLYKKYEDHKDIEHLRRYFEICMAWMDGHAYWMLVCDRYLIDEFKCILHTDESEVDKFDDIDIRYGAAFGY